VARRWVRGWSWGFLCGWVGIVTSGAPMGKGMVLGCFGRVGWFSHVARRWVTGWSWGVLGGWVGIVTSGAPMGKELVLGCFVLVGWYSH
jgi:hypothetical protein